MTDLNCSGVSWVAGTAVPTPALLTKISTRPKVSMARAMRALQSSTFVTSVVRAAYLRPAAVTRAPVSSRRSVRRAPRTTSAPASAKALANATPRPEDAPVTTATFESKRKRSRMLILLLLK